MSYDRPSRQDSYNSSRRSERSGEYRTAPPSYSSRDGGASREASYSSNNSGSKWAAAAQAAERGGPSKWEEEDRMNDSGWLQGETKRIQNESVSSSRRALARLNEAQSMGESSLNMLNSQSEQFNRMERKLDEASANAKNVEAKVDHLKSLNKYFFLPSFGGGKAARREEEFKRQQEEQSFQSKTARQRDEHWNSRNERVAKREERFQHSNSGGRSFYSTPEGLERDDTENEIDNNLGQISSGLSRLKMMGLAMNEEMDSQQDQLRRINDRTDATKTKVDKLNGKVDQIVDKKQGWLSRKMTK